MQVFPPRAPQPSTSQASSSSSPLSDDETQAIHKVAEDMKIPVKDSITRDDPAKYYYKVQILEEDKQATGKANQKETKGKEANKSKYSGSLMDVRCTDMRCVSLPVGMPHR